MSLSNHSQQCSGSLPSPVPGHLLTASPRLPPAKGLGGGCDCVPIRGTHAPWIFPALSPASALGCRWPPEETTRVVEGDTENDRGT